MRQSLLLIAHLLVSLPFQGQSIKKDSNNVVAFSRVTVLDMNGGPAKPNMTVVVTGNQIITVHKSQNAVIQKGATVVDARGKFLMPGLWDMHVHALRQQGLNTDNFFALFIANGVTGVREMGNSPLSMTEVRRIRNEIAAGRSSGPRFYFCGPLINGQETHWTSSLIVNSGQRGRAVADSLKKAGVDFLKVYSELSREVYFAIAEEARKLSIPFAGHVPEAITPQEASTAGQKSFEHMEELLLSCSSSEEQLRQERNQMNRLTPGSQEWWGKWSTYNTMLIDTYSEEKVKKLADILCQNQTWQCPTLTALHTITYSTELGPANQGKLKFVDTAISKWWLGFVETRKKNFSLANLELMKKRYHKNVALVGDLKRAGVSFLAGTDDLIPFVLPGFSLHQELALLVEAGLSPLQALQTATLNPAKYFGLTDSTGTVEKGKWADLLLLDANPLENITNTQKIAGVVANGRYYSKQALQQLLKEAETTAGKN